MKKSYTHLTLFDRQTIEIQLQRWTTQEEIAKLLKRSKSSISREIQKNSVVKRWTNKKVYLAQEAHIKAFFRRYYSKKQSKKINMNSKLRLFLIYHLTRKDKIYSPKSIAKAWNDTQTDKKNHISHTLIYEWLNTSSWEKYKEYLLYKKGYKKVKKHKWNKILWRIWLDKRPEEANNRTEKWHFEADLIVSKKWFRWALLTLIDRMTRMPIIIKLKSKDSAYIMKKIAELKDKYWIKSVTFDNWMEFAKHYLLNEIWIDTYFSDPYSPWQKGSIENLNRIIRRFFPKGTIFDNISWYRIKKVCNIIANSPKEILDYISPYQAHFS